jgi:hypothetical protein
VLIVGVYQRLVLEGLVTANKLVVVRGSWFVVRGSWFVVRGSWFVVRQD